MLVLVLVPTMQSDLDHGWEDLFKRHVHVIPSFTLQDLQSLSACCRGFQAFVRTCSQDLWLLVARCGPLRCSPNEAIQIV